MSRRTSSCRIGGRRARRPGSAPSQRQQRGLKATTTAAGRAVKHSFRGSVRRAFGWSGARGSAAQPSSDGVGGHGAAGHRGHSTGRAALSILSLWMHMLPRAAPSSAEVCWSRTTTVRDDGSPSQRWSRSHPAYHEQSRASKLNETTVHRAHLMQRSTHTRRAVAQSVASAALSSHAPRWPWRLQPCWPVTCVTPQYPSDHPAALAARTVSARISQFGICSAPGRAAPRSRRSL